ncbi:TadE/TadG family type IV pilus assembly protein [Mesorhizobium sp. Mes31]|uniref:TadE/TadG family type IV pilus assembly protein n=1 Tax=Mesorhizobium sp. Mes31 TaxID=2926017 RepID=UPI0021197D49|nr:TadE/TadG family type IV pilus assembly protein [Mesorhizobium sp. Mes31]
MRGLSGRFIESRSGSLAPILILSMIPLLTAVGFSVDYTSAVQTRSNMQAALDAGILAITTMPTTSTLPQRQVSLQDAFTANGGEGTATLGSFVVSANGTATAQATASYSMPTVFMKIARIDSVPVAVAASVTKTPALVQTTFKVTKVSGYWGKTMTLYGTQFGATAAKPLMTITYAYNGFGDPKGYGTTTVNTITNNGGADISTTVQKQVCTTTKVSSFKNAPAGSIQQTSGSNKYLTTCVDTFYPADGAGAVIDVSQMNALYLQMDVPSGNPKVLKSNDPATSNRLYIGTSTSDMPEVATGQTVDIFTAVPCGVPSYQAWEDGGNAVPAAVSNADFFYNVNGKCDFNQRPSDTVLTQ